ncbi:hypothetical protein [Bradyrhizobium sp. JYMT SZCCT0428]|uniref:hypothetical protein n=1 Tax=Bradyrhizobium sp. JYMT SZCCT0428 TaxID=2807673 RepID=UPI001BAC50BB|nr:hypothetical protein [Bradyrhizobium sp. JYMT SZCCT0428]MBR1154605.1 hypothetical protein [Bradyrhizobium sp. JYMT SZCCT0428]
MDASAAALTAAAAGIAAGSAAGQVASAAAGAGTGAAGGGAAAGGAGSALGAAGTAALPWVGAAAATLAAGAVLRATVGEENVGLTSGERMRRRRGGKSARELIRDQYSTGWDELPGAAGGGSGPVKAELTGTANVEGEATIKVDVTVTPSSEVINATATAKSSAAQLRGMLNANGPGSTGKSSPDAAAPSPRGNTVGRTP